jgi:3-hydroxyacyl-CoA dehydrogenase
MLLPLNNITLIGTGTIGLSFCALHLRVSSTSVVTILDPRPDLKQHLHSLLPTYLPANSPSLTTLLSTGRLVLANSLEEACTSSTHLVQECGPENITFKRGLWPKVEALVSPNCHLWTSTSGISASQQAADMKQPGRLLVAHPFNPPHLMPLIELVPGPQTPDGEVEVAREFWDRVGYTPVVVRKEVKGFVANRLAFVMFREACTLVEKGVVSVEELDRIVEASVGIRWGVKGPFKSYHDGGGKEGMQRFMENIGGTIGEVWEDAGKGGLVFGEGTWEEKVVKQTHEAYGEVTERSFVERDRITRRVMEAIRSEREAIEREKSEAAKKH